jgi:hypothetical protein
VLLGALITTDRRDAFSLACFLLLNFPKGNSARSGLAGKGAEARFALLCQCSLPTSSLRVFSNRTKSPPKKCRNTAQIWGSKWNPRFDRSVERCVFSNKSQLTAVVQSADLLGAVLAGKEGTADPTELIELIEDLAELEEAGAGEFKTAIKMFLQKVHVKNFPRRNRQKFRCQVFLGFYVLSRFRVFLSDGSSKTLQKTFYKKIVSKSFNKKIDKKIQNRFSRFFFSSFWGISVKGVKNTKKISGKN